jgi:hypothetical protein
MRIIILINALLLLPISAVEAAEYGAVPRYQISNADLERCTHQRTPWFWPTRADLIFARRLCLQEGPPRRQPYFDLPW